MSRTLSITFITCLGLLLSGQQLIAADDRQQAGIVLAARGKVTAYFKAQRRLWSRRRN